MAIEVALSTLLQPLVQSLMSPIFEELFKGKRERRKNIVGRLKVILGTISAVLIDAEDKQITNPGVLNWVNDLKDAVYHAEDVLDDITTEASLRKKSTNWKKLLDKIPSLPSGGTNRVDMKSKLMRVTERLENLDKQSSSLGLIKVTSMTHIARLKTTSLIGESGVIGRQTDKEKITEFLMADYEDNIKKSVVAIVGIGGIGKTTLAKVLYKEQCDENHLTVKAWIHVSEEVNVFSLTKSIYESVTSSPCAFTDLNLLQVNLQMRLKNKKFLIVLDDIWSETFEDWDLLCLPFETAARASRIIVTTRSHHVAEKVRACYTHTLQPLSFQECWELFMEQIRDAQELNRELSILARQVVEKCQGLPLAARALGGLLWSNRKADYWRTILNSKIWDLPRTDSINILRVLKVSYHYLPPHLKRCFAYCSIFPKGYAFDKEKVILLWMAEGLLQQAESTESMEYVGDGYFSELVSRSLFERSNTKFKMHDLINELAQFAAGKFCFKFENQIQGMSGKTRHFSYLRDQYSGEAMKFEVLHGETFLRTFLPLSLKDSSEICCLDKTVSHKLIPNLTCLRVLSLSNYSITMLPQDIFKSMRHVRYLDFSRTNLERLPKSVCFLYNLQTLLLSYCRLIELEEDICNLISLENLDLTATRLNQMPKHFGKLKNLQTLTTFVVGVGKGARISELRDLIQLRGKLTILELDRVKTTNDAKEANLESKTHLKEIEFDWGKVPNKNTTSGMKEAIFATLRPHNQIEELTIKRYYGNNLPMWMSDPSFSSIVCLSLTECENCTSLPSLGRLAGLKELHISKMGQLRSIGPEFYSSHPESRDQEQQPFRSLQVLEFKNMAIWEDWVNVEVYGETLFPNLQKISIVGCPKLACGLPGLFPSLTSLRIRQSENVVFQLDTHKYEKLQQQGVTIW